MNNPSSLNRTLIWFAAGGLCWQTASAASVIWSGAGDDDNWPTPGTSGPFGTANNSVDSSLAISRLTDTNLITVGYHTTQIPLSVTVSVTPGHWGLTGNTYIGNDPTARLELPGGQAK